MLVTTATELPRLMVCIGSRLMPAALPPDHDYEARDEGNAAHWLAKEAFEGRLVTLGTKAYNGYVITDEMMEHVKTYLDALDCGEMEVETTWVGRGFEVRARADHISFRDGVLTVDDFKYGWRIVEPTGNWTLIAHAIGWCVANVIEPTEIVFRIIQPRPYHPAGVVREWRLDFATLMHYHDTITNRLSNPTDELTTSSMCAKCHALAHCPAARVASMNAIDATGIAFNDTLTNDVLAFEYETLKRAEATIVSRREALEELMTHKVQSGTVINGYTLKARYANSKWKPGITGQALSAITGKPLVKDAIVTPAEAKRRGVPQTVIDQLTERPMIGTKLERIDADKEARRFFP